MKSYAKSEAINHETKNFYPIQVLRETRTVSPETTHTIPSVLQLLLIKSVVQSKLTIGN